MLLQILERVLVYYERIGYLLRKIRCDYVHRLAHYRNAQRKYVYRAAALHVLPQPSEKKHTISPSLLPARFLSFAQVFENVYC